MLASTITLISFLLPLLSATTCSSSSILRGVHSEGGHRYNTFKKTFDLAIERNATTIVETGTMRNDISQCYGDGCSTLLFSRLANCRDDSRFFSVDISPEAVLRSANNVADFPNTKVVESCSLAFLAEFPSQIDVLYLDSYDYRAHDAIPCQAHHVREIIAAYNKLHKDTIILLDDCGFPDRGKCKMVEEFLDSMKWIKIMSEYQSLYIAGPETILPVPLIKLNYN